MFGFNEQTFVQKDGALLKLRDLHSVEGLFKTKMTKNGEECQKFREVKKALEKENWLKEEYEKDLKASEFPSSEMGKELEARFLIEFLFKRYQTQLIQYVHNGEALKWLQDALIKSKCKSKTGHLGVFDKLHATILKPSFFKVLKLLSKNGNACFSAVCINVVLRELLVRYLQFKTDPSALAFTEDEKEFYEKMINLENSTASWLQNAIYQVNTNPQNSKPIKLDTDDAHIPADEPSRLHQYSFILRVLQALGCSAQQVNIRVGMVFEGEILVDSPERRYTQTTENARGPLSNNRWKIYEFLYPKIASTKGKDRDVDHRDESKRPSVNDERREEGVNDEGKAKQNEKPDPDPIQRSYSEEELQDYLSLLLPSDNNNITESSSNSENVLTLVNSHDDYSISSIDRLFQNNQVEPKDLVRAKRSFYEISTEKEEEDEEEDISIGFVESTLVEENSSPPKRVRGDTMEGPHW
eukprot:gene14150-15646_t